MLIRLINRSTALFGWTNFSHRPRILVVVGGETVDLICPVHPQYLTCPQLPTPNHPRPSSSSSSSSFGPGAEKL
ncbi:MAG: hypothetical protein QOH78_928 [Verrucomicrobiota bacterium]